MLTIEPASYMPGDQWKTLLILFNASDDEARFRVPKIGKRRKTEWQVVLDTSREDGKSAARLVGGTDALVAGCSILVGAAQ